MTLRAVVMARATCGEAEGGTSITPESFESAKSGACGVDKALIGTSFGMLVAKQVGADRVHLSTFKRALSIIVYTR
jgi:hypothetical protein